MMTLDDLHPAMSDAALASMNFLNEVTLQYPEAASFAAGRPFEQMFDVAGKLNLIQRYVDFEAIVSEISPATMMDNLGQYGRTKGVIHRLIAELMKNDEGMAVDSEAVVITVGCQEAMALCVAVLCGKPGDVALACEPAYVGFTGLAKLLGVSLEGIPLAEDAIDFDIFQDMLSRLQAEGRRPRLLYCCPDFSNPTGVRMSLEARKKLLAVCERHDISIFEDATYRNFSFNQTRLPSLKELDRNCRVLHCGTFSKTLFPGLRVAYLIADQQVRRGGRSSFIADDLSKAKSMLTNNTSAVCQAIVGGYLLENGCSLSTALESKIEFYKNNLNVLLEALSVNFPVDQPWTKGISWSTPEGGFFVTLRVPFETDYRALHESASEYGVIWVPMREFYLDKGGECELRLAFSYLQPNQIVDGVQRLAVFVHSRVARATKLMAHV